MHEHEINTVTNWNQVSQAFALITIVIGIAGLTGWILNSPQLYTFSVNSATMKFNTAILLVVMGGGVMLLLRKLAVPANLASLFVIIFSLIIIAEYSFHASLGIDEFVYKEVAPLNQDINPGRVSLLAAIAFIMTAFSICLFSAKRYSSAQLLVFTVFIFMYAAVLGHIFKVVGLYNFGNYSAISFPTALGFISISLALLFYFPHRGWISPVFTHYSLGFTARYTILYFLLASPLFVGVCMHLININGIQPEFAMIIVVIGSVLITLPLAYILLNKMNKMDEELHFRHQELNLATETLTRNKEELVNKNNELIQINEELDHIIHMISHDLRTPITSLQGALEILGKRLNENTHESEIKLLTLSGRSVNRLKATVDNLNRVLKAQKPVEDNREKILIEEVIYEIQNELASQIAQSGTRFCIDLRKSTIVYQKMHFYSIMQNLISNGIKYRCPLRPHTININSSYLEGGLHLSIEDNGLGIPESKQSDLFTMYKRFHDHVEGTGVGLYLVKRIIEARGGCIEVASTENVGTRFNLFFKQDS